MADEKLPDSVTQGLTRFIPEAEGGSRPKDMSDTPGTPIWHPFKPRSDSGGTPVIYVSFDAPAPRHDYREEVTIPQQDRFGHLVDIKVPKAVKPRAFSEWEKGKVREAMRNIMNVSNVQFIEVGTPGTDAANIKPEDADLCFFSADQINGGQSFGYAEGMGKESGKRDILMVPNRWFLQVVYHEMSHAVGAISHFDYKHLSIMAPEVTDSFSEPVEFGVFDAAIWQKIFGKSKQPAVGKDVVTATELASIPVLYRDKPVTVDLSDLNVKEPHSLVRADLSQEYGAQIKAPMSVNGQYRAVSTSVVPGTQIQNVVFKNGGKNAPPVYAKGNDLINQLQGGGGNDILWAAGGGDTLTGGDGADIFRFDAGSGAKNVITDFQNDDRIQFAMASLREVTLRNEQGGTEVVATDARGTSTSVFVAGRKPSEISDGIFQATRLGDALVDQGQEMKPAFVHEIAMAEPLKPDATPVRDPAQTTMNNPKGR